RDTLRHRLVAFDHILPVQRAYEGGLADLAMADEDRPHALELLGERAFAKALEISVDLGGALRKLLLGKQSPLRFYFPIVGFSIKTVPIPIDPNLETGT